ncbi:hypothetical protein L208DRAFT_1377627 [Tricholoma matsutake]|nr:hypothetical protein L208DRAFT_1377627 [Tricholoma matsutake 945]
MLPEDAEDNDRMVVHRAGILRERRRGGHIQLMSLAWLSYTRDLIDNHVPDYTRPHNGGGGCPASPPLLNTHCFTVFFYNVHQRKYQLRVATKPNHGLRVGIFLSEAPSAVGTNTTQCPRPEHLGLVDVGNPDMGDHGDTGMASGSPPLEKEGQRLQIKDDMK